MGDSQTVYVRHDCDGSDAYPRWFLEQLQELRSEGHLVDVTLCAEGKEIPCHRLVLSALTDYFNAMFRGCHRETKKDKIEIGGVSAEALELLVDFAYTSKISIPSSSIQCVFEAANMLQVEPIEQVCEDILTEHYISPETCLGTWALADKVSCQDLLMKAKIHALKNFEEVCMNEEFLELSVEFLKTYISDEGLHAKKEERVLEAIMLWARHDLKGRQSHLKELLECVRFSRVDQDYLKDIVEKDKVLAEVPGVKELIKDQSTCVRPRHIQQEEILILAGRTLLGQRVTFNNNMYRLDLHGDCIDMTPLPESLQETATGAVCVVNNDVIVTGGYSSRFEAWVYKPSLDSWSELSYLKRGRFNHGMAVLQGKVYVVGGDHPDLYMAYMCKSLPEVEVYSEVTNSWELVAPLKQGVCDFAIATCCEKIYVFGGRMCRKEETAVVQCYDPTQNVWTFAKPLPKSMTGIQACTVNSKIYLVGGQLDHVLCYDPQEDCYEEMADRLCPWGTSSATVCGSEIYITGGFEKDPTRHEFCRDVPVATVQCYNVSSDTMVRVKDLPLRLRYHNIVTIPVTKP